LWITTENFNKYFGDVKSIYLGSAFDNGKTINLYKTEAEETISQENQDYINGYKPVELTDEEKAIALLESLGYKLFTNK